MGPGLRKFRPRLELIANRSTERAKPMNVTTSLKPWRRAAVPLAVAMTLTTGAAVAPQASAAPVAAPVAAVATANVPQATPDLLPAYGGAYGIVAVHNGSWGYKEIVYGRGTTAQLAASPYWDLGMILSGVTGWGIPLAVTMWAAKTKAQEAVNTNQCFALVRPTYWPNIYWPARESWGCR